MTLTCASARVSMCVMADAPIPLIIGGNKTGPRHRCTKCRLPVHGNACGTQLSDEEQLKQMGIPVPFDISCLPSEGQVEMKLFNNEGCIMCHTCASDIATKTKSPFRCPDTTTAVPVAPLHHHAPTQTGRTLPNLCHLPALLKWTPPETARTT